MGFAGIQLGFEKGILEPHKRKSDLQKEAQQKQATIQNEAVAAAQSQRRTSAVNKRKANQQSPNVAALLASAIAGGAGGVNSTVLTQLGGSRTGLGGGQPRG